MEASHGGRIEEALAWLDEALRVHPDGAEAHNGRGEILWDDGRIDEALAPFGLNFSRFEALALLHFSKEGRLPLGKMGDRLQVHPASITNTIDRLQQDRLVERVPHPTDGRTTLAVITDAGVERVGQAQLALAEISFGLADVSGSALRSIRDDIVSLRRRAGDFGADD